jgi:hypothetical protein
MAHWRKLPEHLRRGLLRLYVVVSVAWVVWFGYQLLYALNDYVVDDNIVANAFWWLLVVPVGAPILFLVIAWIIAGFQKKPLEIDKATEDKAAPQPEAASHRSIEECCSVILHAISKLPDNTDEAREALYERVRTTFDAQLDGQDPSWIKRERRTLENAIQQVELVSSRRWGGSEWQYVSPVVLTGKLGEHAWRLRTEQ